MRRLAAVLAVAGALAGCGSSHDKAQTRTEVIRSVNTEGGFDAQTIYKAEAPGVVTVLSLFGGGDSGEGAGFVLNGNSSYARGGDVITKVGDTPITSSEDLGAVVSRLKPGSMIAVEIKRGGDTRELKVKLGERPLGRAAQSDG